MTTNRYNTSQTPLWGFSEHRAPEATHPTLYVAPYARKPRSMPVRPRSPSPATPDKTKKVWVAVRVMEPDSLHSRERTGDTTDTGGRYAPILTKDVLDSEIPIRNAGKGRYACTHKVTAQFHLEGTQVLRVATVGVSKAAGPFDQDIRAAINTGGYWTGAAYPDKMGGILDTQLCVSGAPNHGEPLIDAARREVMEELGVAVELRSADIPAQWVRGVKHHLFWAEM